MAEHAARNGHGDSLLGRSDMRAHARRPIRRPTHQGELPHGHLDRVHDGADAFGAAPGGLPARHRRRSLSSRDAREDGDNVLARDPAVGERDPRSEDRQLMLDALMAATEQLVITYTGADERTGARRPPAVPLGELLDTLDDTARSRTARPGAHRLVVRHPLQPYDSRTMECGALGRPALHVDPAALGGARAAVAPRVPPGPTRAGTVAAGGPEPPSTSPNSRPARASGRGFLRQRLDVAVRFEEAEPSDAVPVQLDGLQRYQIGERLLRSQLSGTDAKAGAAAEWRRGTLPPGRLGDQVLDDLLVEIAPLVEKTATLRGAGEGDRRGRRSRRRSAGARDGRRGARILPGDGRLRLAERPLAAAGVGRVARPDRERARQCLGCGNRRPPRQARCGLHDDPAGGRGARPRLHRRAGGPLRPRAACPAADPDQGGGGLRRQPARRGVPADAEFAAAREWRTAGTPGAGRGH